MKYGTVPVARATGGIKDTVTPVKVMEEKAEGTGILFENYSADDFLRATESALDLYNEKKDIWRKIQINGMKEIFPGKNLQKNIKLYIGKY